MADHEHGDDEKVMHELWDQALNDDRFTYDMCMVFTLGAKAEDTTDCMGRVHPGADKIPALTGPDVVEKLKKAGLRTRLYQSIGHDEVYCLIGASESRLELEADRIDLDLLLDREKTLSIAADEFKIKLAMKTKERDETCKLITSDIWNNIYGKFDPSPKKKRLYTTHDTDGPMHKDSFFKSTDRINLTVSIIEAPVSLKGAGLSITRLIALKNSQVKAFFPLHEPSKLAELSASWCTWHGVWTPPLESIRDYYGEKVALYFAFLNWYTKMLVIPSFFGGIWILVQRANNMSTEEQIVSSKALWFFALLIIGWSTGFLESWKRRQAYLRIAWGMGEFKQKEQTRPEFRGEWVINPVDGKLVAYFPVWKKALKMVVSQAVVISLIILVVVSVFAVFYARIQINKSLGTSNGAIVGALINVVVIQFFNIVYNSVGKYLNEFENHRTDSDYENSLIAKSFLFKFVNSYFSLFYIAFFKNIVFGDSCYTGQTNNTYPCLNTLSYQLAIVFGSMIIINNFFEVFVPWVKGMLESKKQSGDDPENDAKKTFPEKEFEKNNYESTFDDYDELAIQFGFVVLFVVALPLAPLLAFLNNLLEAGVDSGKLVRFDKRPEPRGAYDIGTWYSIFNCVSWIAIMTNIAICVLYTNEIRTWAGFSDQSLNGSSAYTTTSVMILALIFFGAEHFLAFVKFAIEYFIPDEPTEVTAHIARQQYLIDLLIRDAVEEEDDSDLLMADDDEATAGLISKKEVQHVAELFTMLDDDNESGDTAVVRVPRTLVIDDHCNFKSSTRTSGGVQELATNPV
jgi:anoctamin-10/anoctamin-7